MQQNELNLPKFLPLPQQQPVDFLLFVLNISGVYAGHVQSKFTALAVYERQK